MADKPGTEVAAPPAALPAGIAGRLTLRRHEERRVLSGHVWVFSNEIERIEGTPSAGSVVAV